MEREEGPHAASPYALKRGSYELEKYLFAGPSLQRASWVVGKTIYGDVRIDHRPWSTFTRPVFAYLNYVDTFHCPGPADSRVKAMITVGHGEAFSQGMRVDYGVAPAIDRINTLSELSTGFEPSRSWSGTAKVARTIALPPPGHYVAYQLNLVYAHCARSAAGSLASAFAYHQQRLLGTRRDLFYLSEIATSKIVVVPARQAIDALNWDAVQKAVLKDGYRASDNSGQWNIDFSACGRSNQCY